MSNEVLTSSSLRFATLPRNTTPAGCSTWRGSLRNLVVVLGGEVSQLVAVLLPKLA